MILLCVVYGLCSSVFLVYLCIYIFVHIYRGMLLLG